MLTPLGGYRGLGPFGRAAKAPSDLLPSLVLAAQLEEASGTRADATGRGNTLSQAGSPGNATGIIGNAVALVPASSQYLYINDGTDTHFGNVSFTFCVWAYPTLTTGIHYVVCKGSTTAGSAFDFYLRQRSDLSAGSQWEWVVGTAIGTNVSIKVGTASLNIWHLLSGWYNSSTHFAGLSVNGGASTTGAWSTGGGASTKPLTIGNSNVDAGFNSTTSVMWSGRLDELYLWNGRALVDADFATLYNSGVGLGYPF